MTMENLETILTILEKENIIHDYEVLSDNEVNIMKKVVDNEKVFLRVYYFSFNQSKTTIEIEDLDYDI